MATSIPRGEYVPTADQRCVMRASWTDYEALDAMRGESARPRITYLDGAVELMSPSTDHEQIKSQLGALLESYCNAQRIKIKPVGSWTIKDRTVDAALEPDECYWIGSAPKARPDLAIEVVWTSGGLDKLEVYRRLAVAEVWFWIDRVISVHVLGPEGYEARVRSEQFPRLDLAVFAELAVLADFNEAIDRARALP
ncbi:MAG: Uma2 family endonuclease [Kofleriaceae bacterium]